MKPQQHFARCAHSKQPSLPMLQQLEQRLLMDGVSGADIAIASVDSLMIAAGRTQELAITVCNESSVPVAVAFPVDVYLSLDGSIDADRKIGSFTCSGLGAWETLGHTLTVTAPAAAGMYQLIVVADPQGVVPEAAADLDNNVYTSTAEVSPVYTLLHNAMLTPGTKWVYDFRIDMFENQSLYRTSTATVSVSKGPVIAGMPSAKMTHTVKGMSSSWEYVATNGNGYILLGLGDSYISATATEPLTVMPQFISPDDQYVHLDSGRFTGKIKGMPGTLDVSGDSYVTYVGQETLTTPAGTFDCTIVRIDIDYDLSNGWSVQQQLTWWVDPDTGPIRRDFWESAWTPDRETTIHSATQLLSTNVQGPPDLQATVQPLPANSVPGDKITLPVTVANSGKGQAKGKMDIVLYASASGQLDGSEIELARMANQSVSLKVGYSKTYNAKLTLPALPEGQYAVVAVVDAGGAISETNEANNLASSGQADVLWQFGSFAGRKNVKLTVPDSEGRPVVFSLKGPGTGQVTVTGNQLGVGVVDSSPASTLTIAPTGKAVITPVAGMLIEGSLKAINAPMVDLNGLAYVLGSLGSLKMHDAQPGAAIRLGQTYDGGPSIDGIIIDERVACAIRLNELTDSLIHSAWQPIKSLTLGEWLDEDGAADQVAAPSISKLTVRGDKRHGIAGNFEADLNIGDPGTAGIALGSVSIAGLWDGSTVTVDGVDAKTGLSIKSLKAGKVGDVNVAAPGGIGAISTSDWQAGMISAGWLGSVGTKANRTLGTVGDFGADLRLAGSYVPARKSTLRSATIAGDLLAGTCWDVQAGLVGSLTFGGTVRQSLIRSADNIKSITVGASDGSDVGVGVTMSLLESSRHVEVGDVANTPKATIGTFTVKGLKLPKGTPTPRLFVDSCISAGIGKLTLLNWDTQGGLFAPDGGIKSIRHKDTLDKNNCWVWPAPPTQVSDNSDAFVHII